MNDSRDPNRNGIRTRYSLFYYIPTESLTGTQSRNSETYDKILQIKLFELHQHAMLTLHNLPTIKINNNDDISFFNTELTKRRMEKTIHCLMNKASILGCDANVFWTWTSDRKGWRASESTAFSKQRQKEKLTEHVEITNTYKDDTW